MIPISSVQLTKFVFINAVSLSWTVFYGKPKEVTYFSTASMVSSAFVDFSGYTAMKLENASNTTRQKVFP